MDVCLLCVLCCQVEVSATDRSLIQMSPTDCGASCVIKKPRKRGGYSPTRGLQNTNPQWVVAPVEQKGKALTFPNTSILTKYTFYFRHTFSVKCFCVGIIKRKCLLHLVICQSRYFVVRTCTGDVLVRLCLTFYAICMGVRAGLFHGA
jgi:hypothetical protein